MDGQRRNRVLMRTQNWLYVMLVLVLAGLAAWLSTRYVWEADWTSNNRNSLSESSIQLVSSLDQPITLTAYAREGSSLRRSIRTLVTRYQRAEPAITLEFVNPDTHPARVRELGITVPGTLVVSYDGGTELVTRLDEQSLTNALARLARQGDATVTFLAGHGERSPQGKANFDMGQFGRELKQLGIHLAPLNLARNPGALAGVQLLVIADPQVALLAGEVRLLKDYLANGGNLLWLAEPGADRHGLNPLAQALGISFLPGVVVDPTTRLYRITDPAFALVVDYPDHPLVRGMKALTLFPHAAALAFDEDSEWNVTPVLRTVARTWTETGEISGTISFNENSEERAGPLTIGLAMTRAVPSPVQKPADPAEASHIQRIAVLGDGDFLSNTYLGNGVNLELGVRLFNWLLGDDDFIEISPKTAPDVSLKLSKVEMGVLAACSMFALPLLLLSIGITIWWRRRRR